MDPSLSRISTILQIIANIVIAMSGKFYTDPKAIKPGVPACRQVIKLYQEKIVRQKWHFLLACFITGKSSNQPEENYIVLCKSV